MPTIPTSNTITMTVNLDKTASLSRQNFGSQGEDIEITVVVPAGISGSGYDAYIDFIQPDGLAYFKGPYDCSSGTFSFFIGVLDSLMDIDGDLSWQFLLAETAGSVRTVKWAANRYKNPIYASVGATSSAILPYVPQMVYPDDYPASLITLEDAAGRFTATETEAALAELAGSGRTIQTVKANADAVGTLASLTTTAKTSVVAAINEVDAQIMPVSTFTLADDAATSYTPPQVRGLAILYARTLGTTTSAAIINYRADATPFCFGILLQSNAEVATGALAGTTGTDGKTTISAHTDGKIYIENRRGSDMYYGIIFMGN